MWFDEFKDEMLNISSSTEKKIGNFFSLINDNITIEPDKDFFSKLCNFSIKDRLNLYAPDICYKKDNKSAFLKAAEAGNMIMLKMLVDAGPMPQVAIPDYHIGTCYILLKDAQNESDAHLIYLILKEPIIEKEKTLIVDHIANHLIKNWNKSSIDNIVSLFSHKHKALRLLKKKFVEFVLNKNLPPLLKYLEQPHLEPLSADNNQLTQKTVLGLPSDTIKIIISFVVAQTLYQHTHKATL